jgi:hypothetical protein
MEILQYAGLGTDRAFWLLQARDCLTVFCCMRGMCCAPWQPGRKAARRVAAPGLAVGAWSTHAGAPDAASGGSGRGARREVQCMRAYTAAVHIHTDW